MRDDLEAGGDVTYIGPRAFVGGFALLCGVFAAAVYGAPRLVDALEAAAPAAVASDFAATSAPATVAPATVAPATAARTTVARTTVAPATVAPPASSSPPAQPMFLATTAPRLVAVIAPVSPRIAGATPVRPHVLAIVARAHVAAIGSPPHDLPAALRTAAPRTHVDAHAGGRPASRPRQVARPATPGRVRPATALLAPKSSAARLAPVRVTGTPRAPIVVAVRSARGAKLLVPFHGAAAPNGMAALAPRAGGLVPVGFNAQAAVTSKP